MTIVFSPEAHEDLTEAYDYLAQESKPAADRLLARITELVGMLASGAIEGREVHLRDGRVVRTWVIHPYRIFYRRNAELFQVVRLYHHARRPIHR